MVAFAHRTSYVDLLLIDGWSRATLRLRHLFRLRQVGLNALGQRAIRCEFQVSAVVIGCQCGSALRVVNRRQQQLNPRLGMEFIEALRTQGVGFGLRHVVEIELSHSVVAVR